MVLSVGFSGRFADPENCTRHILKRSPVARKTLDTYNQAMDVEENNAGLSPKKMSRRCTGITMEKEKFCCGVT